MQRPGTIKLIATTIAVAAITACATLPISADATLGLTFRGTHNLDTSAHTGSAIGGLSGVTYLGEIAGQHRFLAVQDSSNQLVTFDVAFNANGSIASADLLGVLTLSASRDHEGIAYTDATRNSVFVSSENPAAIHEHSLADGSLLQTIALPTAYSSALGGFGLESLTRQPDGSALWTANEEALPSDGQLATTTTGSTVRLQRFSVTGNTVTADSNHHTYTTAPIHAATDEGARDASDLSRSGLVDLVALPDGRLLALERSLAVNGLASSFQTRLYEVELNNDLTTTKHLLLAQNTPLSAIGNLEGLTLGPQLANGNHVLLGVVDNAYGDDLFSGNRLVTYELTGSIPEPGSAGIGMVMMIAIVGGARRVGTRRSHGTS